MQGGGIGIIRRQAKRGERREEREYDMILLRRLEV